MTQLILTRGLPASGKSTWARKLVEENTNIVRLNRDDFRQMLFGKAVLDTTGEAMVTAAQHGAVDNALAAGFNVVVDDTNFFARGVKALMLIARKHDAKIVFQDFTHVSLEECLRRDEKRRLEGNSNLSQAVGEQVIRGMHDRYIKGRQLPLPVPDVPELVVEPYNNPVDLPHAVIVDIDGTLAKMTDRSPFDWHRVGEDNPVPAVIAAVSAAFQAGNKIIVMSGRDSSCRYETLEWLIKHLSKVSDFDLFMRPEKDNRRDDLIKVELFNNHVRNKFHVEYVLDDRDQVIRAWRKLGLNTFQVAPGNF